MENKKIVKRGRKTKLVNDDVKQTILEHISKGNYIQTACLAAGIHINTYLNWVRLGEEYASNPDNGNEYKKIYYDFCEELKKAEAQALAETIGRIDEAGKKPQNWMANAWKAERKYKDLWGRQEQPIVESKVLIALQDSFAQLKHDPQVIEGEIKQIESSGSGSGGGD